MTTRELREKRANVWSQMQEMRDAVDKDGWSAELREKWDRADEELTSLTADIEREERNEQLGTLNEIDNQQRDAGGNTNRDRDVDAYQRAFVAFLRGGLDGVDVDQRQLLQSHFIAEERAQGAGTGAAGGYTVPQGFWAKVTETLKYFGGMTGVAEILNTDTGNAIPWPTNDDTTNVGAILAENSQITGQDVTFGQKTLNAYTYTSKLILVSLQLLQDTGIDLEGFLARKIGERLGRIYNTHLTTGTGSAQPQGFVTGATVGKTTASATAITYNEVVDLEHSVDAAYRAGGRCRYMFHDLVLAYLRKVRDDVGGAGLGRPLWQPSVAAGVPDTFNGFAYTVNNDMDSTVATTKKTMAFGDFNAHYVIRQVSGGTVMRLAERYADFLQVGFFGFGRLDGLVQDASAVKVMQQT
jgi:HK97 family phage major capsid protein